MKYMLLIYHNLGVWEALPHPEKEKVWSEGAALWKELTASGEVLMGEPLGSPRNARIVQVRNGFPLVTDGPFSEAKEQLVGFVILNVASEERAIELAARWPEARIFSVEVRRIDVGNDLEGLGADA